MQVVEPFTWTWVLAALASGVLSWAAGRIMDGLFPAGGGGSIEDVKQLLVETMRQVLSEHDFELLEREEKAIVDLMTDYANGGGVHRLDFADIHCNEVIIGFRKYGEPAADLLGVAEGIKIAVLQEYTKQNIRDETANIKRLALEYALDMTKLAAERKKVIDNAYRGPFIRDNGPGEGVSIGYFHYGYFIEEEFCPNINSTCPREGKVKAAEAMIRMHVAEIERRYKPLVDLADTFVKLAANPMP